MRVQIEIIDHEKIDLNKIGINQYTIPEGFLTNEYIELREFPQSKDAIQPFLQNYSYSVVNLSWNCQILRITPACNTAKIVFDRQYKNK